MRRCDEINLNVKQTATKFQITRELTHSGCKHCAMVPVKSFLARRWHEWMNEISVLRGSTIREHFPMEYGESIELIRIEQKNSKWMRTSQCFATSIDARMWMPHSCDCICRGSRARKISERRTKCRSRSHRCALGNVMAGRNWYFMPAAVQTRVLHHKYVFVVRLEIFASLQLWMPSEQLSYLITHTRWVKNIWLNGDSDRSIAPFYVRSTSRYRIIDVSPNQEILLDVLWKWQYYRKDMIII